MHVAIDDGLSRDDTDALTAQRRLVVELGGTVHEVVGHNTAESLVAFAKREKATQLVLGATRRSRWHELIHGSFVARVTRLAGEIDVHVIAHHGDEHVSDARHRCVPRRPLDRRRLIAAWLLTVVGLPLLMVVTVPFRDHIALSTELLVALAVVVALAALGGKIVAAVAAVGASLLVNWFYVPPYGTLTIAEGENVASLLIFVAVALGVGTLVDIASRRAVEARRARLEAEALARSTTSLAADPDPLPQLVELLRETFGLAGVRISGSDSDGLATLAAAGDVDGAPTTSMPLASSLQGSSGLRATLQVFGRPLSGDDQRLLRVFADQLSMAIDSQRLVAEAEEAAALADLDALRTALLRSVSHDLRTPLASIKAMISGLRDPAVTWTGGQLDEALKTVDEETDRLNRLVGNLLDASRLQIGTLAIETEPTVVLDAVEVRVCRPSKVPTTWRSTSRATRAAGTERSGVARAQPRQRDRQRTAPQPCRPTGADRGRSGRRLRAHPRRRSRPRDLGARSSPSNDTAATTRRRSDQRWSRSRPLDRPGIHRRDGRRAHARRHPGRRADRHDRVADGAHARADGGSSALIRVVRVRRASRHCVDRQRCRRPCLRRHR